MECILRERERGGERGRERRGKETEKEKREEEREEKKAKKIQKLKKQYFLNSLSLTVMMVTFI